MRIRCVKAEPFELPYQRFLKNMENELKKKHLFVAQPNSDVGAKQEEGYGVPVAKTTSISTRAASIPAPSCAPAPKKRIRNRAKFLR